MYIENILGGIVSGLVIAFDGIDGCGKDKQIELSAEKIGRASVDDIRALLTIAAEEK